MRGGCDARMPGGWDCGVRGQHQPPECSPSFLATRGRMQVPAPDDNIKRPVVPRMTSSTHDAALSCHPHDVCPSPESFLVQFRQPRGARPRQLEVTSLRGAQAWS